jgi:hypothetical protein
MYLYSNTFYLFSFFRLIIEPSLVRYASLHTETLKLVLEILSHILDITHTDDRNNLPILPYTYTL